MNNRLIVMLVCFGFSSTAVAGMSGTLAGKVSFDQGVDVPAFISAATAMEAGLPDADTRTGACTGEAVKPDLTHAARGAVAEFGTMGRHEGSRVYDGQALVSIDTQIMANGTPDSLQLEIKFQEIPKDAEALAVDPDALAMTVNLPIEYYSAILEAPAFFEKEWDSDGKNVEVYATFNGKTKFIQITQTSGDIPGAGRISGVLKLIVSGREITMAQLEKFNDGYDTPYFSEYIVMATKVAQGMALMNPGIVGRISEPSLIKYVAEAPTPERIMEVLGE